MNKIKFPVISTIICLVLISIGCGVGKVSAPVTSSTTGSVANVNVTLASSSIANGGSTTVTATVSDGSANPVPNATVSFSVISSSAGACNPTSAVTDAAGSATTTFTASTNDTTATVMATVTVGSTSYSGSATITIGTPARVPTSIVVNLSSSTVNTTSPGNTATVSATVSDASGGISGVNVTFSLSDVTAGSLDYTSGTTDAAGVATVTFTAGSTSMYVDISASTGSLGNSQTLQIGNPPPPTPASMSLTINPLTISIGGTATASVTLQDSSGNPVFNTAVTLTITTGSTLASFAPFSTPTTTVVAATTNSSGIATATIYAGNTSGAVTIQSSYGTLTPRTASLSITSDPDSITVDVLNPNLLNGQTTNITADVRNIQGNAVSDGTVVTFEITAGATNAGSFTASQATTVNGIASVSFIADSTNTGSLIVTASAGTSPVVSGTALIIVNQAQTGSIEFVSASPDIINIAGAGTSSSSVKFKVLSTTGSPLPGISVSFVLYGPTGATLDATNTTTSSSSTDSNGEVTTLLKAGTVAGPVRIVASVTVSGVPYTTSSGNISIGGGVPSDRWFDVSVSKFNLDGLACNGVTSQIGVWMADRFGNYNILEGTSVSFATDAGAIDTSNVTDATGVTSSLFRTQSPLPTDVPPIVGEPSYTVGTHTYNPRDGWFTIVVMTTGEEYFVDDNANGVYDSGETSTDLPEPFLDSDDSGVRNTGELFFDWPSYVAPLPASGHAPNPNGVYDDANGEWNEKIPIYRILHLVMTGAPAFSEYTTRITSGPTGTGNVTIPKDGYLDFYVYLSDINMNTPIAGTSVSLSSDKTEADVKLLSGSETAIDTISMTGPSQVIYRVTNENFSAATVIPMLSAGIDWPGACGTVDYTISYPGTITLAAGAAPFDPFITAASGPGTGEVTITWADEFGATSYNLYWGTSITSITNSIAGVTSPYVFTGTTGTTYYFKLTAVNSVGESSQSAAASAVAP